MSSAKRALFQTPTRSSKRRKTSSKKPTMRIPKSLLPETKQYVRNSLTSSTTNEGYSSIAKDMSQGSTGDDFIGSKFRVQRIRVNYDIQSSVTLTEGVRITVLIPKRAGFPPVLSPRANSQWDTHVFTVLHDLLLPDDPSTRTGTFDVVGPINVETNSADSIVMRNDIHILAHSAGAGADLASTISYAVWYTDA